jgi:hypothetical protein
MNSVTRTVGTSFEYCEKSHFERMTDKIAVYM